MCGLTGFWQWRGASREALRNQAEDMSRRLTHRGPDDGGLWCDESVGIALAQRRLSILDLSEAGHQPMHSACGRYVITFNGEIYNHLQLRGRLAAEGAAPVWRGHSDTETIIACFAAWGIERTLRLSVGMFAFAAWDRQQRTLTLARDRMGEKPLYYGWCGDILLFGSELKALKAHPSFDARIDRDALTLFLRHDCVPAPYTIYRGVLKLQPGHLLRMSMDAPRNAQPEAYWRYNDVVAKGLSEPLECSDAEAADALENQLRESISAQMLSDVPLGAFLSGGIDSSTIVALMQASSRRPVKTFTIGFDENGYDEAVHAGAVAEHLGTEHTELYIRPEDALAVIPKLPSIFCEPFGDSSQVPTFLVSQMTRREVVVALSGDGGDELFGGYNRYLTARTTWRRMLHVPRFARQAVAGTLRTISPASWDRLMERAGPLLPKRWRLAAPGEKAHKLAEVLLSSNGQSFFLNVASRWKDPASMVIGASEPSTLLTNEAAWPSTGDLAQWMMAMDAQSYLPDDILVKVDRAAMANSLETRVPMLDHRVVELAWRLPFHQKIRHGQGKWLMRQVLYRHVPKALVERPKMGFAVPLDSWLRGPLRDWAESLLSENRLRQEGYFDPAPIRQKWDEHLSGRRNWQYALWTVLMFQAWLEANQGVLS
ncbi:asparagine synthase (glutamine-hydrolyzing) [Dyella mobilis]|uniref:asparagine synthase (glutamine-hydrolyzing) n=1 Tax=Dyella mobilis TaxID=1849582 RepID=A0ABS2KJP3_9GAMM|nr:asparagine synthase (glutamine-hydrolyzing) [Dyella mobilis]MBM7131022.1 asparagine synthase (glutamine-hydrolyzing) [Dyella mobilis]GLQ97649.1 asparagine synthetase B [Dyella mobilis]